MRLSDRPRVLFVAGDPGGAYALVPVIRELIFTKLYDIEVLGYYQGTKVFRQFFESAIELSVISKHEDVFARLSMLEPDIVVTASSSNHYDLEKQFIAIAKEKGMKTLTVLDFWSNYRLRFSNEKGELQYLPDKIAVIDDLAYREMCAEGFPEDRLVITGQPAFDTYLESRQEVTASEIKRMREKLFADEDKVVLFLSQPFAELFGRDRSNPRYPGYAQQDAFDALFQTLKGLAVKNHCRIGIGVAPHLRERTAWWEEYGSEIVPILPGKYDQFSQVALTADVITGMTSTRLVNASILGILTVSLQLGVFDHHRFDMERFGISKIIYTQLELEEYLQTALFGETEIENSNKLEIDGKSAENIIQLIESMLAKNTIGQA